MPIFEGDAALHLKKISKIFCSLLDNRRAQKNPIERGRHRDRCRGIEYPYGKERSSGCLPGRLNYKEVYTTDKSFAFDEPGMDAIYEGLNIPVYKGIDFANLLKYDYGFYLDWQTEEDREKNKAQIFTWCNGAVMRYYLYKGEIHTQEYLYLH